MHGEMRVLIIVGNILDLVRIRVILRSLFGRARNKWDVALRSVMGTVELMARI